ncbi:MAG: hypothetical protein ALAOOOJD_02006 [bacterium]|nr:hypothetical protein [bacterium]
MTFLELARRVLEEEKKPLSVDEIWTIAKFKRYDQDLASQGKTPWATIAAQIYVNIRDSKNSPFIKVGARPRRFTLRALLSNTDLQRLDEAQLEVETPKREVEYLERDLHPFLSYYAYFFLKAYTKTIQHTRSDKKEFGEWIHPDLVGCYFPVEDWKPEVIDFGQAIGNIAIKLFSFEIKRELTFANLRESFFQTVSNSSWSHEGYLVAAEVSTDEDFLAELRRLSTSFGIGVIRIDIDDPDSSEIVFPAKPRESLDWDTINKLMMNPDFKEFLRRIKIDISSNEIRKEKYDRISTRDELIKMIKRRK